MNFESILHFESALLILNFGRNSLKMNVKVEQLGDKNMYRLIIEASAEEVENGIERAYKKVRGQVNVPGFRKGKAPRKIIEQMYGKTVFYNDAADEIVPELYEAAAKESGLDIASHPILKVIKMDDENPMVFTADVAIKPEVELGTYKGVEVAKQETSVSDDEVNAEIEKTQNQNSRTEVVEGRPVQNKDIVSIDFEGFIDDVPFEGGKGTNYPLTIGSHTFIDTFEDQLVGANVGDEVEVKVTFPEDYQAEALKGKEALFKVTVNEIKEKILPALDDEFAQDVSEFDTFADYKADVKKKLEEAKAINAKNLKERFAIDQVIANSKMDIADPIVNDQITRMINDFQRSIEQQGMSVEQYLQYAGATKDQFRETMKPDALKRLQQRYVVEAIVKAENIEVSDEEFEQELEAQAKRYNIELSDFKNILDDEARAQIKEDAAIRKAIDLVVDTAVEVEDKVEEAAEEKKPAAKKTTTRKTTKKADDAAEEKKPAAKKTTAKKAADKAEDAAEEKKPAAKKKTTKKAEDAE